MKKGDVETYIEKFETLRRSVDWPEETIGTITQFQCGLGAMHTREIREGKIPRPVTLKDWYAAARNQWKGAKTEGIREAVKEDARAITPVASTPIIVRATEVKSQMSELEVARWQQALVQRQTIAEGKRRNIEERDKEEAKRLRTNEPQLSTVVAIRNETVRESAVDRIIWTRDVSVDRVNSGPHNSLYVRVNFEHSQGREAARGLIDSGATENFVDIRTAERWGLPWKTLPNPRSIINVDGTNNKAGAVTEACILDVLHKGNQQLQRFYVTDLGFDRVLLGYPWLHGFNPQIDWKKEGVEGEVTLKTIANAWER